MFDLVQMICYDGIMVEARLSCTMFQTIHWSTFFSGLKNTEIWMAIRVR